MISSYGIYNTNTNEFNNQRLITPVAAFTALSNIIPTNGVSKMYNADRRTFMYNMLENKDVNSEMFSDMYSYYNIFRSFVNNTPVVKQHFGNISDVNNLMLYNEQLQNELFAYDEFKRNYSYTTFIKNNFANTGIVKELSYPKHSISEQISILEQKYPIPELSPQQKKFLRIFYEHPTHLKYFMRLHTDGYFYVNPENVLDSKGILYPYSILSKRSVEIQQRIRTEHPEIQNTHEYFRAFRKNN